MSELAQPSLSVRTHHKFRNIESFLHQKVRTSASEEPPSLTCGRPERFLITKKCCGAKSVIRIKLLIDSFTLLYIFSLYILLLYTFNLLEHVRATRTQVS